MPVKLQTPYGSSEIANLPCLLSIYDSKAVALNISGYKNYAKVYIGTVCNIRYIFICKAALC